MNPHQAHSGPSQAICSKKGIFQSFSKDEPSYLAIEWQHRSSQVVLANDRLMNKI